MDQTLRCNSLRCRQVLTTQAVVTNCSHIFCVDWYVLCRFLLTKVQTNCSRTRELVHCVNLLSVNQTFHCSSPPVLTIGRLLNKLETNRVVYFKIGLIVVTIKLFVPSPRIVDSRACYLAFPHQQCSKYCPAQ